MSKNAKPKTVKMKFSADQYYVTAENKARDLAQPLYEANKEYEIDEKMVGRWLKRGGVIVAEAATDSRAQEPAKVEDKTEDKGSDTKEQVEDTDKKEEDGDKPETAKTATKPADEKKGGNKR